MLGRRELGVLTGAGALALSGCDRVLDRTSRWLGRDLPEHVSIPRGTSVSRARRLLDRAAFGPWPSDEERVQQLGEDEWIEEQLHPESIDDTAASVRTALTDVENIPADLIFELRPEHIERQLRAHTIIDAVYSERQLQQVMVSFWSDHFNVHIGKGACRHLTLLYVRDVLRQNALGTFRDLLRLVVLSPAMLVYLDGRENVSEVPNENYARELLELHTLGVHGGYSQSDVMEAARCLTGWTLEEELAPGQVRFDPARHDDGSKSVFGQRIEAGGGETDVDRLIDLAASHPSCARHIATRLCQLFISDVPPESVVAAATDSFVRTDGDIRSVVRTILRSPGLVASAPRIKRPFRFVVSTLRAFAAETHARSDLQEYLRAMGQALYDYPTPDGYPVESGRWVSAMLPRWRFAVALLDGQLDDTQIELTSLQRALGTRDPAASAHGHLVGRAPTPAELVPIERYLMRGGAERRAWALSLVSPSYLTC